MIQRYKYPRTPHMPFSPGCTDDDKMLPDLNHFIGKKVVVTEKMDGENYTLYPDYYSHARSIDSGYHPSRNWVKSFHSGIAHEIPKNMRICGENMYAQHSIEYNELESFFYAFSVWYEDRCVNWMATELLCKKLGINLVPVLWIGKFDENIIKQLASKLDLTKTEGFVMRIAGGFDYCDFDKSVAKYVRAHHVTTDDHWMSKTIIPNKLKI